MDTNGKEPSKPICINLPESLYQTVKLYTEKNGMTMTGLIKIAIENELEKRGENEDNNIR